MGSSDDEALWVLRAQCGDREALEHVLRSVQPSLKRYLAGLVGASDAEDVLQDVLVVVFRKLRWLERPELFRPWVFRIGNRAGLRHLKKTKRRLEEPHDEALLESVPSADVLPDSTVPLFRLEGVSPASRAVLMLHFQEEMKLTEIAAILEIPLGTVKSRLAYGLAAIRNRLGTK